MAKSNDRKNITKRRKKKNLTPYAVIVASVGVVAFSVSGFQIYKKAINAYEIMKPINTSNSQAEESQGSSQGSDDTIQDAVSSDNNSSNSSEDSIPEASESTVAPEINEYEILYSKKNTAETYKPMLTGSELDLLLTKRTGVSSEGIIVGEPEADDESSSKAEETDEGSSNAEETGESSAPNATNTATDSSSQASSGASSEQIIDAKPKPIVAEFVATNMPSSGAENIAKWKKINSDVIGYIKIPNTNISYPVVVGPDNLYYENKDYYKKESKNGVIWADSYTKFGNRNQISKNTVIYGHNWTNCTDNPFIGRDTDVMFAQLTQFQHYDFAKESPYIYYSTDRKSTRLNSSHL